MPRKARGFRKLEDKYWRFSHINPFQQYLKSQRLQKSDQKFEISSLREKEINYAESKEFSGKRATSRV